MSQKLWRSSYEVHPHGLQSSVLYASSHVSSSASRFGLTPTEFVSINTEEHQDSIVYNDDSFEINVISMCAISFDLLPSNSNELLLYSIKSELSDSDTSVKPVPFIHFDPEDRPPQNTRPGEIVPIPSSKALYTAYNGAILDECDKRKQILFRFNLMEIDEITPSKKGAIQSIERLGNIAQQYSITMPQFGVLASAFGIAANIGKKALEGYSKADYVLSVDYNFLLCERLEKSPSSSNNSSTSSKKRFLSGDFLRVRLTFNVHHKVVY